MSCHPKIIEQCTCSCIITIDYKIIMNIISRVICSLVIAIQLLLIFVLCQFLCYDIRINRYNGMHFCLKMTLLQTFFYFILLHNFFVSALISFLFVCFLDTLKSKRILFCLYFFHSLCKLN